MRPEPESVPPSVFDATHNVSFGAEPLGGAHRDIDMMAQRIKEHISEQLSALDQVSLDDMLERRYQRLMSYGN